MARPTRTRGYVMCHGPSFFQPYGRRCARRSKLTVP
jgi:hypothetical protein